MLNPNNDRLFYGNILYPPDDYVLDFAFGTTYSLDLDALIGASISLCSSEDIDFEFNNNPIFLLESLRKISDKIAIFTENGQIHLPNNPNKLYILLEDSVFQVVTKKEFQKNRYASFHPKMWLLRFIDNNNSIVYRLIVLSRNLTFDRSWDISFTMDGQKTDNFTNKNDALIKFINYLSEYSTNDTKTNKMREIAEELRYVDFNLHSRIFEDFDFIVNGIGEEYSIQNHSLFDDNLDELLIMSPFLSSNVIKDFNNRMKNKKSKALLFTRLMSISKLRYDDCNNFELYALKDEIIDGETIFSEESQDIYKQDIHAKVYAISNRKFTDLYFGSLNASHNALWGNIEFMIKLQTKNYKFNVNDLANDLFNNDKWGPNDPFQLVNIDNVIFEEDDESKNLDLIIKYISRLDSKAAIFSNNDSYNIKLTFENIDYAQFDDVEVYIKPLLSNKQEKFTSKLTFEGIPKIELSEFFTISVKDKKDNVLKRVIKINCHGMPMGRDKELVSSIITDKASFIKYVAFLLGDDYVLSLIENQNLQKSTKNISFELPELYEKMLKAACYSPEKFKEIEFLINSLSNDKIVPEGFYELYNTFIEVID